MLNNRLKKELLIKVKYFFLHFLDSYLSIYLKQYSNKINFKNYSAEITLYKIQELFSLNNLRPLNVILFS